MLKTMLLNQVIYQLMWQNTCYNNELKLMKKSCRPKSELTASYVLNKGFCFVLLNSVNSTGRIYPKHFFGYDTLNSQCMKNFINILVFRPFQL